MWQRATTILFYDPMHKELEDYVEDMITNFASEMDHLVDLQKVFEQLTKYNLKLNPGKCVFGATSDKLLGIIVSQHGIKTDPAKIKQSQRCHSKNRREVMGFLSRINCIGWFITQLTTTYRPLFKLLRRNMPVVSNEDC